MRGLVSAGMWLVIVLVAVSMVLDTAAAVEGRSSASAGAKANAAQGVLQGMGAGMAQRATIGVAAGVGAGTSAKARMRLVETREDGGGLDVTPHFRFEDSSVDSSLLDDLNNMLIQTQARAVREKCQLLGNWFGWIVQATLGAIAFSALIVKKYLDPKPRDWMTWFRDASKQAIGAIAAHFWNLLFATLLQRANAEEDPCVYYLVNYLVDVVLGCILSLLLLWAFESMADKYNWEMLRSGDYGGSDADQCTVWKRWAAQCALWIGILTVAKLVCLFCLIVPAKRPLYVAGAWLLSGLVNYPRLELVIVMIVIPLVLNIAQFWVQDSFLMSSSAADNAKFDAIKPARQPAAGDGGAPPAKPLPHGSPSSGPGAAADASAIPSISVSVSAAGAAAAAGDAPVDAAKEERAGLLA